MICFCSTPSSSGKGGTAGLAEVVAELEWDLNTTADCKRRRGVVGRGFERPAVAATQPVVPVGWHGRGGASAVSLASLPSWLECWVALLRLSLSLLRAVGG